jgi:hypothetical protein
MLITVTDSRPSKDNAGKLEDHRKSDNAAARLRANEIPNAMFWKIASLEAEQVYMPFTGATVAAPRFNGSNFEKPMTQYEERTF